MEAASIKRKQKIEFLRGVYKNGYFISETDYDSGKFYILNQKAVFRENQKIFSKLSSEAYIDGEFVKIVEDVDSIENIENYN